jgi:hypothetical protein
MATVDDCRAARSPLVSGGRVKPTTKFIALRSSGRSAAPGTGLLQSEKISRLTVWRYGIARKGVM